MKPVTYLDYYGKEYRTRIILDPNDHTKQTIKVHKCGFTVLDEIKSTLRKGQKHFATTVKESGDGRVS